MGEYRNGKWTPTFGDEQFGVVDRPGEMYNRVRELETEIERLRALVDAAREYEKMFACSRTKPYGISNELQALFDALAALEDDDA